MKYQIIAIVFLGISILIGSFQITNGLLKIANNIPNTPSTNNISSSIEYVGDQLKELNEKDHGIKNIMYMTEAANYVGLTFNDFKTLIEEKKTNIPYVKVNNLYIFHKESLDEWLQNGQKTYEIN